MTSTSSEILVHPVRGRKELREFVCFPFKLYENDPTWVPPLISDELKVLDSSRNPAFEFCQGSFWLARRGRRCLGRIAAFINKRDNEKRGARNARFGYLDFTDDPEVCRLLLESAESWALGQGMEKIEGPLGLTTFDPCAVLIQGFEHVPTAVSTYNYPYFAGHIESCGFQKEIDYIEQHLPLPDPLDPKYERIAKRTLRTKSLSVLAPRTKRELLPHIPEALELVNECYSDLYEFVPLTPRQMTFLVDRYLPALDPNLVKLVRDATGVIVGAGVALPSLSRALQAARGRLFPFGWWRFLRTMKRCDTVDLYLIAVKPELRHSGLSAILITEMQRSLLKTKLRQVETNGVLETNDRVFSTWKGFGATTHKRRRIYSKILAPPPPPR